jgi:hypothetical protein
VYDEIPDSCPYSGAGADLGASGQHTVYGASADGAGDKELPISASFKVDAVLPTVTCPAAPPFLIGSAGLVTATVADDVSGPATPTVSSAAHTKHIGTQSVTVTGANNAGGTASVKCTYKVYALKFDPEPTLVWAIVPVQGPTGSGGRSARAQTYSTVKRLLVTRVPTGATVNLECRGRGCPVRSVICSSRRCRRAGPGKLDLAPLLAHARLRPGAQVTVIVRRSRTIARVWILTIRRGRPRYRATCQAPGSNVVGKGC